MEKWIIPSCKIHMVEEETLDEGLKGGGKEELGKGEWVSRRPRYDNTTLLH